MVNDSIKPGFAQRLREAMEAAGYVARPAVLEREFNTRFWGKPMTLHGVRRWLRGETMPSQDKLVVLADWLRVPAHELAFGEGQPGAGSRSVRERRAPWYDAASPEDREVFAAYLRLNSPQRRTAREVIMALARPSSTAGN